MGGICECGHKSCFHILKEKNFWLSRYNNEKQKTCAVEKCNCTRFTSENDNE